MSSLDTITEATIVARQRKLMATARLYADSIQSQPGVVGIVLYGSLALGDPAELTQFSDVDLAVILDRDLPTRFAEHRLVDGIKLDVTLIHMGWLREQVAKPPEGLDPGGRVHNVLIKSLLLENAETILFDPTGEIAQTRRKLNELTTYPAMAVACTQRSLREVEKQDLVSAREQWQHGRFREAMDQCGGALWTYELDRGKSYDALVRLWACDSKGTLGRCEGLASALTDIGHDVTPILTPFLEDPKLRRLGGEVDRAGKETLLHEVSPAEAERAVRLAEELRQMVDDVLASRPGAGTHEAEAEW